MRPIPAIVRRIETWPRCMCMTCVGLDLRYPDEGYQLAFWRYEPVTRGPRRGDVHILTP